MIIKLGLIEQKIVKPLKTDVRGVERTEVDFLRQKNVYSE